MAGAPAVSYPVGRTGALATVLAGLLASAWSTMIWAWIMASNPYQPASEAMIYIAIGGLSTAALWHFWRQQPPRQLRWDGACWWLLSAGDAHERGGDGARVQVRLDAQRWMLLRFHEPDTVRPTWLWAQAAHDPVRWHLLRCALYLPATSAQGGLAARAEVPRA